MILRRDLDGGPAALLSLPARPVHRPARLQPATALNAAFQDGPQALIDVIKNTFGIPIQHYVEIDFQGFKSLVNAIGGVQVCTLTAIRDTHTACTSPHRAAGSSTVSRALPTRAAASGDLRRGHRHLDRRPRVRFRADQAPAGLHQHRAGGGRCQGQGQPLAGRGRDGVDHRCADHRRRARTYRRAAIAMREAVGGGLKKYTVPVRGKNVKGTRCWCSTTVSRRTSTISAGSATPRRPTHRNLAPFA